MGLVWYDSSFFEKPSGFSEANQMSLRGTTMIFLCLKNSGHNASECMNLEFS